jgi:hypothetical protein
MAARSGKSPWMKQAEQAGKQDHGQWIYTRYSNRSRRSRIEEWRTGVNGSRYHGQSDGDMRYGIVGGTDGRLSTGGRDSLANIALFDSSDIRENRYIIHAKTRYLACSALLHHDRSLTLLIIQASHLTEESRVKRTLPHHPARRGR